LITETASEKFNVPQALNLFVLVWHSAKARIPVVHDRTEVGVVRFELNRLFKLL
jgi:hypothetical protein